MTTAWPELAHRVHTRGSLKAVAYVHIPIKEECDDCGGIDPFTGGPLDVNCATCNGTGYVMTDRRSAVRVNVLWMKPDMVSLVHGIVGSAPMGDLVLVGDLQDKRVFEAAQAEPSAYILLDGDVKVRPTSVIRSRTYGPTSLEVDCSIVSGRGR